MLVDAGWLEFFISRKSTGSTEKGKEKKKKSTGSMLFRHMETNTRRISQKLEAVSWGRRGRQTANFFFFFLNKPCRIDTIHVYDLHKTITLE